MAVHVDSSSLTPEQRQKFATDGYLVLEDLSLPDSLLDGVVEDLEGLYQGDGEVRDGVFYARHRIGEAWKISANVRRLALDPGVEAVVEDLFSRRPLPFQTLNF